MLKGALRITPLESDYPSTGVLDDTPLEVVQELATEAKTLGNEGLRVVLDYDDFVVRPLQKFVNHMTDSRWTSPEHNLYVLIAFNSNAFRREGAYLGKLE